MLFFEVQVALGGDGDKVDVRMRHFETNDGNADTFARKGFFDGLSHFLGEDHHLSQFLVTKLENVIHFLFRHHQGVAFGKRIDVEESEEMLVLSDFIAGDFPLDDS